MCQSRTEVLERAPAGGSDGNKELNNIREQLLDQSPFCDPKTWKQRRKVCRESRSWFPIYSHAPR